MDPSSLVWAMDYENNFTVYEHMWVCIRIMHVRECRTLREFPFFLFILVRLTMRAANRASFSGFEQGKNQLSRKKISYARNLSAKTRMGSYARIGSDSSSRSIRFVQSYNALWSEDSVFCSRAAAATAGPPGFYSLCRLFARLANASRRRRQQRGGFGMTA